MQHSREPGARIALRLAGTIALFVAGWMFGVFALSNVPGAISPDGVASDGGVLAFLVVTAAWVSVFWRRRAPIVVALAGGGRRGDRVGVPAAADRRLRGDRPRQ